MIVLSVGGRLREEIHSTVISLLAPDVPVYLWWMQCPDADDHLFENLSAEADRVLVDSDRFETPDNLVKLAGQNDLLIGDLAWARLTPWRQQMAHLWDLPELRDALNHLRTLDVIYVAPGDFANANRALLLIGWLADRFGWDLVEAQPGPTGGYTSHWQKANWEGKAEIVESAYEGLPPGELMGIYMQAGETPPFVMPRLEYVVERGCIDVRLDDASPLAKRRGVHFTSMTEAQALVEELDQRYDPFYKLALSRAADIVKAAGR
jgi:glucose-6-phosphate dehydrogenase assembly protein OpcA